MLEFVALQFRCRVNELRKTLSRKMRDLGVEERAWPGRDDGFASLLYKGKDIAHFHSDCELDVRLGKTVKSREGLKPLPDSTVHPTRAKGSPWQELRISTESDVNEAIRLLQLAIDELKIKQ